MTEFAFGSFRFEVSPKDGRRVRVLVFQGGQPLLDLHGQPYAKGFAPGVGAERLERFCRRFATDEAYRARLLVTHAFACC